MSAMQPCQQSADNAWRRCAWAPSEGPMADYHDNHWGRPVVDEAAMFERICLETFQAGLSWALVLARSERLREAFCGFDPYRIATWQEPEIERCLAAEGVIRNRAKVAAVVSNAAVTVRLAEAGGSLVGLVWRHRAVADPVPRTPSDIPAASPNSTSLAAEMRSLGYRFVGPVSAYATLQAAGVVNDHLEHCPVRGVVAAERVAAWPAIEQACLR